MFIASAAAPKGRRFFGVLLWAMAVVFEALCFEVPMKKYLMIVVALLLAMPVFAGVAERKKLSEELLLLMKFDRNVEQGFAAARQMQMAQLKSMTLSTFDAEASAGIRAKTMDYLQANLSWEKLKDEYVASCAETFSEDELKGLIAFYKTPTGKALVEKTPQMMKNSSDIMAKHMVEIAPKIQEIVKEAAEKQKTLAPLMLKPEQRAIKPAAP